MSYSEQADANKRRAPPGEHLRAEARALFVQRLHHPDEKLNRKIAKWRQQGPEYEAAFSAIESLWQVSHQPASQLALEEKQALERYLAHAAHTPQKHLWHSPHWVMLSALCLVFFALLFTGVWLERPGLLQQLAADNFTQRGQQKTITFPDGSTALLDADSALTLAFDAQQRHIRLLRGAAFFTVKQATLPFTVSAANGLVSVTGTRFIVRRLNQATQVTVEHGHVNVSVNNNAQSIPLSVGQQVTFNDHGLQPTEDVDPEQMLAWRKGRFVFYQQRLDDVVSEIERYHSGRILIVNNTLAGKKISGSLDLADPDNALHSLQGSLGFQLTHIATPLTIISL